MSMDGKVNLKLLTTFTKKEVKTMSEREQLILEAKNQGITTEELMQWVNRIEKAVSVN